jgi:hypothetical protein
MQTVLPWLVDVLGNDGAAFYRIYTLVEE